METDELPNIWSLRLVFSRLFGKAVVAQAPDTAGERSSLEAMYRSHFERRSFRDVLKGLALRSIDYWAPPIERLIGKRVQPDASRMVTSSVLTAELLDDLFSHRICGIRIPNFCPASLADRIRDWILQDEKLANWSVKDQDRRKKSDTQFAVGMPKTVGFSSRENFVKYFTESLSSMRGLRAAAAPELSPIDKIRLELEELWPNGAHIARYAGRRMFAGVARVMTPGSLHDGQGSAEGFCHVDSFPVTNPRRGIFSVNVYLEVPADGGELDIWNISPGLWDLVRTYSAFRHFTRSFNSESQRIIRAALPHPIRIKPAKGDVILISTARPHAVRSFTHGRRVTLQSFISHQRGKPLALVS